MLYTGKYLSPFYFCPFCAHLQMVNLRPGKFVLLSNLNIPQSRLNKFKSGRNSLHAYVWKGKNNSVYSRLINSISQSNPVSVERTTKSPFSSRGFISDSTSVADNLCWFIRIQQCQKCLTTDHMSLRLFFQEGKIKNTKFSLSFRHHSIISVAFKM